MNHSLLPIIVGVLCSAFCANAFGQDITQTAKSTLREAQIEEIEIALSNKVAEVVAEDLRLSAVSPNTNVTAAIRYVDELGQQILEIDSEGERILALNESIVAVIDALKQRRIYKYQLWAERRLEEVSQRLAKGKNSPSDLVRLYLLLGEINSSLISENMLNREIMATMANIYDSLDAENKKNVRRLSIHQQADPLSQIKNIQPRRSLDEF